MAILYGFFAYLGLSALFAFLTYHSTSIGFFISLFLGIYFRKKIGKNLLSYLVLSYFFWLGLFYVTFTNEPITDPKLMETIVTVRTYPVIDGNEMETVVSMDDGHLYLLKYYFRSKTEKEKWEQILEPGTFCKVHGEITIPREPSNPNGFHYRRYLQSRNIHYLFNVARMQSCVKGKDSIIDRIRLLRKQGIQVIEEAYPDTVSPIVSALLFGEKEKIDSDLLQSYRQLGIAHLLAISGLHVSVLTAGIYYVLLRIGFTRETTRNILLLFLPVYALLAGGAPSVNRAVMMAWMIIFFSKWKKAIHPIDALGISFLFFLLYNPYILYHVGFQLSYAVSFSLILSSSIIRQRRPWYVKIAFVSMVAQFGSIPILLFHFYEFSLLGIILNIFYVPFYSVVILPLSFTSFFLLLFIPFFATPFVFIVSFSLKIANGFAQRFADFPLATWTLGKPPLLMLLLFYLFFIIGFMLMEKDWKRKRGMMILCFFLPFLLQIGYVKFHPFGEVTFIDVGQGDSIWIRLPFHQGNYLIDTGGYIPFEEEEWKRKKESFDPGKRIVIPFLKSKGVTKIDKLILTHGDQDHIGSAKNIFSELKVGELIVGKTSKKRELEREVIRFALQKKIPVKEVSRGIRWHIGNGQFFILAPKMYAPSGNDSSVVIYAHIGGLDWLFTGDLERDGEMDLTKNFPTMQVDVLKVGHHGSNTSTEAAFLQQIRPKIAVISVGKNNLYGHPHERVLEDLEKAGATIYRTDIHGAVTFRYFMTKGYFSPMLKK
ncbi:DNA internalization-related competence protein ComEC/Rec2 [Fervidibacillus halotolerans]|uniref:DNA internalization-related competence protein ComEC/Rec2 n=1 Tax=Fervidibacillus halotolerans TaxID=2980027 RepID=A0A9E8RXS9_9BACI|nr:DNA internalization-related competence protein ComEC/Rec2 [Fervidibacillus halotolerans]WAA11519.1 DNA internalization-related competence protein ComEC/Rec2 [Fervidibacillus halotolerans]